MRGGRGRTPAAFSGERDEADMSIRAKLLVAFGVVLTLLGGVGLAGWRATVRMSDEAQHLYEDNVQSTVELGVAQSALWELRYGFPRFMVAPEKRQEILDSQAKWYTIIDDSLRSYAAGRAAPRSDRHWPNGSRRSPSTGRPDRVGSSSRCGEDRGGRRLARQDDHALRRGLGGRAGAADRAAAADRQRAPAGGHHSWPPVHPLARRAAGGEPADGHRRGAADEPGDQQSTAPDGRRAQGRHRGRPHPTGGGHLPR